VLVRVRANSLNYRDYMMVHGIIPVADGRIPMTDGAGEVIAVGEGVAGFGPGDQVMSLFYPRWQSGRPNAERVAVVSGHQVDGLAAELVAAPASAFTRTPVGWSAAEAATLPCAALTAWRALTVEAAIKPGDVVLIQGSGGVSVFALQFAKAAGAIVIATSSSGAKLERLSAMGADHLINYREQSEWGRVAAALSGRGGVDVVVEIGGPQTLGQSLEAVGFGGHICMIGSLGGWTGEASPVAAIVRNACLKGLTVGSREQQEDMVRALEATGIRPVIDRSFPLDAIADAFAYQGSQAHFGKICLEL
jgi:NADPH:quinone reductase-like Zn-dependent oxidoreductase